MCEARLIPAAILLLLAALVSTANSQEQINLPAILALASQRLSAIAPPGGGVWITETDPATGAWVREPTPERWTSGFLTGCLWEMYALSNGNLSWSQLAEAQLPWLAADHLPATDHDIGFIVMSSFGEALEMAPWGSPIAEWQAELEAAAVQLAARYNASVGSIKSWDNQDKKSQGSYRVIIDSSISTQLLYAAAELPGGQAAWHDMATSHFQQLAAHHVRPDGSTYHVCDYSTSPPHCYTSQGYSDNSTWSRGQAWAILGFTLAYGHTQEPLFLSTAQRVANYFLSRLPADHVPLWDFDAPANEPYKDSSAAAIAANGLLRLADAAGDPEYLEAAYEILSALASGYLSSEALPPQPASILVHGTANVPAGEFDTGLIYGDYYALQALRLISEAAAPAPAPATLQRHKENRL